VWLPSLPSETPVSAHFLGAGITVHLLDLIPLFPRGDGARDGDHKSDCPGKRCGRRTRRTVNPVTLSPAIRPYVQRSRGKGIGIPDAGYMDSMNQKAPTA
jgi:hypothetical protein